MNYAEKNTALDHLDSAQQLVANAAMQIDIASARLRYNISKKTPYRTPQWHHTILWTGFAFIIGMLIGAGLMAG